MKKLLALLAIVMAVCVGCNADNSSGQADGKDTEGVADAITETAEDATALDETAINSEGTEVQTETAVPVLEEDAYLDYMELEDPMICGAYESFKEGEWIVIEDSEGEAVVAADGYPFGSGILSAVYNDFDQDGEAELLAIYADSDKTDKTLTLNATMCRMVSGEVKELDTVTLAKDIAMAERADDMEVNVFLQEQDGQRLICSDTMAYAWQGDRFEKAEKVSRMVDDQMISNIFKQTIKDEIEIFVWEINDYSTLNKYLGSEDRSGWEYEIDDITNMQTGLYNANGEPIYRQLFDVTASAGSDTLSRLNDLNYATYWIGGAGTTVSFATDQYRRVDGLAVLLGNAESAEAYQEYSLPEELIIDYGVGTTTATLGDDMATLGEEPWNNMWYIDFEEPVYIDACTVTISAVRKGSTYQDSCISEMFLYTK